MTYLMLTLAVLGHLVLAAHALRGGDWGLCAALALAPLLLLTRRGFARLIAAAVLIGGAAVWVDAGLGFVRMRMAFEAPWLRLALIMAALVAASLGSGLWLLGQRARAVFHRGREAEGPQAAAFLLAAGLLALARGMAKVPVLLADRFWPGSGWLAIVALGLYAAWLAGQFLDPARHKKLRPRVWAIFSTVFFGQLALGLLGAEDFLMTGRLHLPVPALIAAGPLYRGGGLFMPILFLSTVALAGPAWCSHLCYIGAWDDQCSRRGPKKTGFVPRRWAILGRAGTLVLACGAALALREMGVPGATAVLFAAGFGLVGVGVMLFVSRRMGAMAHCTAFCPIGLMGNVLGRLIPWRVHINRETCTKCGACARACRYSALTPLEIEAGRPGLPCTLCGDCIGACPHQSMAYRFPGLSPRRARAAFVTLLAALMAVFLGVARI